MSGDGDVGGGGRGRFERGKQRANVCVLWCSAAAVQSGEGWGGTCVSTCTLVNDKSLTHNTGLK